MATWECLDDVVVLGAERPDRLLGLSYAGCYNAGRSHRGPDGEAPEPRERSKAGARRVVGTLVPGDGHRIDARAN